MSICQSQTYTKIRKYDARTDETLFRPPPPPSVQPEAAEHTEGQPQVLTVTLPAEEQGGMLATNMGKRNPAGQPGTASSNTEKGLQNEETHKVPAASKASFLVKILLSFYHTFSYSRTHEYSFLIYFC